MKGLPKMRRVLYIFIACIMMFTLAACGGGSSSEEGITQQENSQDGAGSAVAENALVVYFSATGNTESVAEAIAETQGAELYEIVPEDPYTDEDLDYNNSSSRTTAEQNDENARPAISGEIENIDDYDVIYVGFPIWWNDMPRIMYTFFDTYDFSGKTIAPFCTSGGSGISGAVSNIEELEPSATVTEGLRTSPSDAEGDIAEWLESIGLVQQEG